LGPKKWSLKTSGRYSNVVVNSDWTVPKIANKSNNVCL